jgi:broad specificity phosphatase PhoE
MTLLHLIRHGRASALEADYDRLQPLGELQARLLGEHLAEREQRFDAVYVGPLRRQLETLRIMGEGAGALGAGWPAATVLDGLAEGPFEVLMKQHVRPRLAYDPHVQRFAQQVRGAADASARDVAVNSLFDYMVGLWRQGEIVAEEIEPAHVFDARVEAALELIKAREGRGREVAVVTSNGVIGLLLQHAGLAPAAGEARHRLYNSSVSLLEIDAAGVSGRAYNRIDHLKDPKHLTLI